MTSKKISDLPAAGAITGTELVEVVQSGANAKVTADQLRTYAAPLSAIKSGADITIAGDAITVTGSRHRVATEAAAATDTLSTINGGTDGQLLVLRRSTGGQAITLTNAGNIRLADPISNYTINTSLQSIVLRYSGADSFWYEESRTGQPKGLTIYSTDASSNFNPNVASETLLLSGARTALRTATFTAAAARPGDRFHITNTTTGGFSTEIRSLLVGGPLLCTLATGKWAIIAFDGTNWFLAASGSVSTTP